MLKGVHVTLLAGPVVPLPAPKVVLDALQSVKVTSSATAGASGFELTFAFSATNVVRPTSAKATTRRTRSPGCRRPFTEKG